MEQGKFLRSLLTVEPKRYITYLTQSLAFPLQTNIPGYMTLKNGSLCIIVQQVSNPSTEIADFTDGLHLTNQIQASF